MPTRNVRKKRTSTKTTIDMKPFLFEYDGIQNETKYTLVYAETVGLAFEKINKLINPTANTTQIRLATIL